MLHFDRLTTGAIQEVFAEEILALGGILAEVLDDGERLFARSVLARVREVLPNDRIRDGVALKAVGGDVWIHPYVFRQVCSNGAILAHSVQTGRIENIDSMDLDEAASAIRETVRACCIDEVFLSAAEGMRSASGVKADLVLNLMPMLSRMPDKNQAARFLSNIMDRYLKDGDSSRFGLMNAVTSLARDASDPDTRWRLEEIGGAILTGEKGIPPLARREHPAESTLAIA